MSAPAPPGRPGPRAHPCALCGAAPAPYGFRHPGPRSALPTHLRDRYLWACPDCRAAAETRWQRATGRAPSRPDTARPDPARPAPPAPGRLL